MWENMYRATRRAFLLGSTSAITIGTATNRAPAQPVQTEEAIETASYDASFDYRKHNAAVLRRNSATNQPGTFFVEPDGDRATLFSKSLTREKATSTTSPDWGLPVGAAFDQFSAALDRAYDNALRHPLVPQANNVETDYEIIEKLRDVVGDPNDFVDEPEEDESKPVRFRFTNPLGGLSFEVEGLDPAATRISAPPTFHSAVTAAEMVQLYWTAYLRDVRLSAFASSTAAEADAEDATQRKMVTKARNDLEATNYFSSLGGIPEDRFLRADLRDPAHKSRFGFPGVEIGPFLSQFLLRGTAEPGDGGKIAGPKLGVVDFGTLRVSQRQRTVKPGSVSNYLYTPTTDRSGQNWHGVQNGDRRAIGKDQLDYPTTGGTSDRDTENKFRESLKFITTLRDGAQYVHFDKIYQEYLVAACILLAGLPRVGDTIVSSINALTPRATAQRSEALPPIVAELGIRDDILNFGNPYRGSKAQAGFATFGITHIVTLLGEVSTRAHKAGWYHKWSHRRLRPEEFGARVHVNVAGTWDKAKPPPFHFNSDLDPSRTAVLDLIKGMNGGSSYLLPMAFPEGCPTHPAYPSGHATAAGACVTVLKALFNETRAMTGAMSNVPVYVPDMGGVTLAEAKTQVALSVGGELNKLASNITSFREFAGVHWKSDSVQGILLGEQIALKMLIEQTASAAGTDAKILPFYRERKQGPLGAPFFRLTLFSGEAIDIVDGKIFRVDGAFTKPGGPDYVPQHMWVRRANDISFSELIKLQGFPSYS
jgi:membrane-associated phospholipid phosphatase